ncbi:hypothetical protein [Georgenia sp. SUBG003]|uniref:hypothetical protein n=1 Tax=Georgenia sp. SUBG003 TaxID=1497974 RepID=UPI003AB8A656
MSSTQERAATTSSGGALRIVLGVTGGIAGYKAALVLRLLKEQFRYEGFRNGSSGQLKSQNRAAPRATLQR